jgi:ankyrin repeat protein
MGIRVCALVLALWLTGCGKGNPPAPQTDQPEVAQPNSQPGGQPAGQPGAGAVTESRNKLPGAPALTTGSEVERDGTKPTDLLLTLHPTFADRTDDALLKLVKENPRLVHDMDSSDCTALHYAARYGRVETARWLIGQKADVNTVSYNRYTPMHMVSDAKLAELLIKAGADLDRKDAWGNTPLQSAAAENRTAAADAILASGYKLDLRTAIMLKKREAVKKMLKDDPRLARQLSKGWNLWGDTTPLGLAVDQKDKEIVELLLDAGADVNGGTHMPNAGGNATALTNAVWAGDKEVVKLLLDRGAKTDVTGGKFYPRILDYARKHSDREIVELLEKAEAKEPDRQK